MSASSEATRGDVCEIGGVDDGSLRVCCSAHGKTLCAKHYAVTHFVEVGSEAGATACNERRHDLRREATWTLL